MNITVYKNKQLWCTDFSWYVNYNEVIKKIKEGETVTAITKGGEDITDEFLRSLVKRVANSKEDMLSYIRSGVDTGKQ